MALDRSTTVAAGAAFTRSLALSGIVAWEGIGDAGGKPIDPNPVAINQLLEVWPPSTPSTGSMSAPPDEARRKKRLIALARWHFEGGEATAPPVHRGAGLAPMSSTRP